MILDYEQARALVEEHGSYRAAAAATEWSKDQIYRALRKAPHARGSEDPHTATDVLPEGYHVERMTVQRSPDGVERWWTKTAQDKVQREKRFREAFRGALEDVVPMPRIDREQGPALDDMLTIYPLGDPHFGLLSWQPETGANFDLHIAAEGLRAGIGHLLGRVPRTRRGVVLSLGDFFHADSNENRTPRGGHPLDVDGRLGKVYRVGVMAVVHTIEAALQVHEEVEFQARVGNHDPILSLMLSIAVEQYFRQNPRVTVSPNDAANWYLEFGRCLFGATHGDKTKIKDLGEIMAHDQAQAWGRTTYRHWYVGHHHHEWVKEGRGWVAEVFRTLAGSDFYHATHGYRSGRDLRAHVWHKDYGREMELFVSNERLWNQ